VSQIGTQVSMLALPLVAVIYLKSGPQAVGALVALEFTAFVLVGLPAGALCDRWRRRPVMITGDLARCVLLASVPVAAWLHALTIWQLFAVVLLQGAATTFFDAAYQSYLPSLVTEEGLVPANAKLQGSAAVAQLTGPALAGFLVQVLTAPIAVTVDAASYLFSAVNVSAIRHREGRPPAADRPHMRREIAEGLRVVFGDPILRSLAVSAAMANFFMAGFFAVVLVFLARTLGFTPGAIGLLMSAGSVGGLAGAVAISSLTRAIGRLRAAWLPMAVASPFGLLIPMTGRGPLLAAFVVGIFAYSFAFTAYNVAGVSLRQAMVPPRLRGRMNSVMRLVSVAAMPIGALIAGALATRLGPRDCLWIIESGQLLVPVVMIASPLRTMGSVPPTMFEPST
jgi:MFS family permease